MNYLAHGLRFVDRPYFLAGTAVPDWLSVADRGVRMRERYVRPHVESEGIPGEVAAGIARHLHDDGWFHATPAFHEVTARLGCSFRDILGTDGFRCGFLGHIVCEMLVDTVLIRRDPTVLERYYEALDSIDALEVQVAVNRLAHRGTTTRLVSFIEAFRHVRFLEDYVRPERLLYRLNQVQQRVRLPPLPADVTSVIEEGELVVEAAMPDLLPSTHFSRS